MLSELKIPVVGWPGGNYVSGYKWEDGIGPKDQRPARLYLALYQVETRQMGTDEYVKLCKLIGSENFICIYAGTVTLDQARHWVEYCNIEKGTWYSDLRREYGNEVNGKIVSPDNHGASEPVNSTSADIKFKGNTFEYTFPAHSLTQLILPLK